MNTDEDKSLDDQAESVAAVPIWEEILRIVQTISAEDLAKLPTDGAENHDKYIYGHRAIDPENASDIDVIGDSDHTV